MKKGKRAMTDVVSNPNAAMIDDMPTVAEVVPVPTHIVRLQAGLVGHVVVREHPDKATTPVSLVTEGNRVTLLETDLPEVANWLKIEHQGHVGYVSSDLVTVEEYHDETV